MRVFTHLTDLAKGVIFCAIVLVLVTGITFAPVDGNLMTNAAMSIPRIVVMLMLLVVTRDGHSLAAALDGD